MYVPDIAEPVAVVDQPPKLKPVFAIVPTLVNVTASPPVVYVAVEAVGEPEAPFLL